MTDVKGKIWLLISFVFAVCLTVYALSYMVTDPGHAIGDIGGDGAKNSFTYLYHSMYGKGYWFDGMNYPYGEHITYTDGQPLLSVLFTCFNNVSANTALTAMWLLIGISYVLSIVYIYKTLVHFKVGAPVAVVFAGIIGVFTPQLLRLTGHYALSYTCVVPMLFYWTIKYNELSQWRYCVYIFILGIITAFLHPYFLAMLLIWVVAYVAGYVIFTGKRWIDKIRHALPLSISTIAILAIVTAVIKITDPVKDRPEAPFGILEYTTHFKGIITSIFSPVWQYIYGHNIFKRISDGGEGYTYVGIVVILVVVISFAIGVLKRLNKSDQGIIVSKEGFSPIWLFMAFAALLFSMGVPYIWHMEGLLDYLSFLRQFRTLGRFSWIFYYIITVYSVVVIYTWYVRFIAKRKFFLGYTVLLLSMVIWSYEASGYIKYSRNWAKTSRGNYDAFFSVNQQNWESFLQEHHFNKNDFQAILLLPFFHVGTEKIWIDADGVSTMGYQAALQLHLPIIDVRMSRSSWSEAEKQVKIAAGPYAEKPMLRDIKSNKPFLLLYLDWASLGPDQKYLLQSCDYVGHYSHCNVYACYPDRLTANDKKNADSVNKILPFMNGHDTCVVGKGTWYINHLDSSQAPYMLFGNGALMAISGEDSVVATISINPLIDSTEYEFSCWFLLNREDYRSPFVRLQFLDSSANLIRSLDIFTMQSVDNYNLWFRASGFFRIPANCRYVKCKVKKEIDPAKKAGRIVFYKGMDEIILRPADALIISKSADGSVMVNNHLFKKMNR